MGELHLITSRALLSSLPRKPLRRDIVLGLLLSRKGHWVSSDEIINALWGDDENGGPDWAIERLRVLVHQLRGLGWNISTWSKWGYCLTEHRPRPIWETGVDDQICFGVAQIFDRPDRVKSPL
jgi:hypothetical protein